MKLSEEMEEMVDALSNFDRQLKLVNAGSTFKHYSAPNIPEKVVKKLIKNFDNHLAINSLVGFYDNSLLGLSSGGLIFTNDGFYHKGLGKAMYIPYSAINNFNSDESKVDIYLQNDTNPYYTIIDVWNGNALRNVLSRMQDIDKEYGQSSSKAAGKIKKIDLPPDMMKKCQAAIHSAAVACGGVGTGLAQIPASDNAVMVPIQVGMIVALGKIFDLSISESVAKSIIASAGASIAGRTISQILWGWIPGIGNAINTATAAGLTEAIGWIAVNNFYDRWIEDKNKGRLDGMKDGYVEASGEYERKLRKQAEEFLNQMKDVQKERDEYEKLLDAYEKYIQVLEDKCALDEKIKEFSDIYEELKNLRKSS